jgi:hypothetical protein
MSKSNGTASNSCTPRISQQSYSPLSLFLLYMFVEKCNVYFYRSIIYNSSRNAINTQTCLRLNPMNNRVHLKIRIGCKTKTDRHPHTHIHASPSQYPPPSSNALITSLSTRKYTSTAASHVEHETAPCNRAVLSSLSLPMT